MTADEALRQVDFLRSLPDQIREAIRAEGRERTLQKREILFAEGGACLGMIVILTGSIKVYKIDEQGRELILAHEKPGSSVAELPLFDGGPYPAGAEAAEEGARVLIVPREQFRRLMAAHPEIAEEALRALATRMRGLLQRVETQTFQTVRSRLAGYLLSVASERSVFFLPDTNDTIAGRIGSVRDVVSRTLGDLRRSGILALAGRQVTILDDARLRAFAKSSAEDR